MQHHNRTCSIFLCSYWSRTTLNFLYFCRGVSTWQIDPVFVMCSRHQRQIRDFLSCAHAISYLSCLLEGLQQVSAMAFARFASVSAEQIEQILEDKDSENTKKSAKVTKHVPFPEYLSEKKVEEPTEPAALAKCLSTFYVETRIIGLFNVNFANLEIWTL